MKRFCAAICVFLSVGVRFVPAQQTPPVVTGRISDSVCGASHQARAAAGSLTERECIFDCIKAQAKYVLVDGNNNVMPIGNQDLAGLPLYAGRLVQLTAEIKNGALQVTKIEAIPPHLHIGHVMTNWRDTPGNVGFLIAAIADAKTAEIHAKLAASSRDNLEDMKLHAGHVLNALDPGIEPKGPGSGYGVKKAATGAQQHLDFAVKAEGASANVKLHAMHVKASLGDAIQWVDLAIATAQKIRAAASVSEAAPLANELVTLTAQISNGVDANKDGQVDWQSGEGGLAQAKMHMDLMMKGEGLENMPR
jgi:hypothetical protein